MTAEVAVLNKYGVALAADSAVTVDHWHQGKLTTKVYNSANKVFTLSKFEPVGILFYNGVTLANIPWETIVKVYRRHLHKTKLDTLEEYCDNFFQWLENNQMFLDAYVKDAITTVLVRKFAELARDVKSKRKFIENLDKQIAELKALVSLLGFDDVLARDASRRYRAEIDLAATVAFDKTTYMIGQKRKIEEYVGLLLTKGRAHPSYTGLVIAGFGDKEVLPKLRVYIVDTIVCGKVRHWLSKQYSITEMNSSEVVPLADDDVIKTLTEGISPGFNLNVFQGVLKLILEMPKQILNPVTQLTAAQKQQYIADARSALPQHVQGFMEGMTKYRQNNYEKPLKQAIASLPIGELGIVAETFLDASQLHKRIMPEIETIGGPIDVAVISKGDGFIWIKRKHYFDGKINPAFELKYLEQ